MNIPPATHVYIDEPGCIVCGDPTGVRCCEFGKDIAVEQPTEREREYERSRTSLPSSSPDAVSPARGATHREDTR